MATFQNKGMMSTAIGASAVKFTAASDGVNANSLVVGSVSHGVVTTTLYDPSGTEMASANASINESEGSIEPTALITAAAGSGDQGSTKSEIIWGVDDLTLGTWTLEFKVNGKMSQLQLNDIAKATSVVTCDGSGQSRSAGFFCGGIL